MAGTADRILALKLISDVSDINSSLKKTEGKMKKFARGAASWGKAVAFGFAVKGIDIVTNKVFEGIEAWREGADAARDVEVTWKRLGLETERLGIHLARLEKGALNLGFSDPDTLKSFNRFLQMTKNQKKAFTLLAAAQDLARAEGISLTAAQRRVIGIYSGSARVLREYGVEGKKGMNAVNKAMRTNKGAAKKWARRHPTEILANRIDKIFERLGGLLVPVLDDAARWINRNFVMPVVKLDQTLNKIEKRFKAFGVSIEFDDVDLSGLSDAILPHFQGAFDMIDDVFTGFEQAFTGDWAGLFETLKTITGNLLYALVVWPFDAGWKLIKAGFDLFGIDIEQSLRDLIGSLGDIATDLASNVVDGFQGIWDDIVAIDWWGLGTKIVAAIGGGIQHWKDWLVTKLQNLADAMVNAIKGALNAIIDAWNQLGIPAGSVDLIGKPGEDIYVGHQWGAWTVPQIPRLAKGGIVTSPTLAMVGEGAHDEAIIPLDGRHGMGTTYNITVNVSPFADPAETGRKVVDTIKRYEQRAGSSWRAA